MKLTNEAVVEAPAGEVFATFTDVERVASCLPGATIEGQDGEEHLCQFKVKVGPVSVTYSGRLRFLEVDEAGRALRLKAHGSDIHGNGGAEAEVHVRVEETGQSSSRLMLETDLVITGKIVAFGKGAISGVADRILQQFANNLAGQLQGGQAVSSSAQQSVPSTAAQGSKATVTQAPPAAEALDGMDLILPPEVRRKLVIAGAFTAGMIQGWLIVRAFGKR